MNQRIFDFYTADGEDACGRTFDDIITFDEEQLEQVHDYIQWLFPTLTASQCQKHSPVLDDETIQKLRNNLTFQNRYQQALKKILDFWKISFTHRLGAKNLDVEKITRVSNWMTYRDHNQLRIARVLESARLLGYENTGQSLFLALMKFCATHKYASELTAANAAYWYQAASGIKIAP